ncbi:hypothetical protein BaRGS_00035507 [Batillaria attramentaria]|uniref:Uncharacterized protein n=1 Tax=Batillaria attramentaria TaxID=370345 RepID=A0ABD0JEJ9_9CAEN
MSVIKISYLHRVYRTPQCPSCQMAEFCSSQGTRMTECRNVINQTALTLPGLPSMDDAVDIYPKKTLFTNLMAVYNTTFQYTVAVDRMAESELANVCGTDSTCGADCSDPLDVPGELVPYCTLRGVYLAFDDLLNEQLKPVLTSLHGPVPEPQAIIPNSDTTSGNQWPCFTDLLLLAAANRQMMEAKTVMTTSVLTQL